MYFVLRLDFVRLVILRETRCISTIQLNLPILFIFHYIQGVPKMAY
jgi:hypothetical protein